MNTNFHSNYNHSTSLQFLNRDIVGESSPLISKKPKLLETGINEKATILSFLYEGERVVFASVHPDIAEPQRIMNVYSLYEKVVTYLKSGPYFRVAARSLLTGFYEKVVSDENLLHMRRPCLETMRTALDTEKVESKFFPTIAAVAARIKTFNQNPNLQRRGDLEVDELCTTTLEHLNIPINALKGKQAFLGSPLLSLCRKFITSKNFILKQEAIYLLTKLGAMELEGTEIIKRTLEKLLQNSDSSIKSSVIFAIAQLVQADPKHIEWFKKVLEGLVLHIDAVDRGYAASIISCFGANHPKHAEWVKENLEKIAFYTRIEILGSIVSSIGWLGLQHPEYAEWAKQTIEKLGFVKNDAAWETYPSFNNQLDITCSRFPEIDALDPTDPDYTENLKKIIENSLNSPLLEVQADALVTLEEIGAAQPELTEWAKKSLEELIKDANDYILPYITSAVGTLGATHPKEIPWAIKVLEQLNSNLTDTPLEMRIISALKTLIFAHQKHTVCANKIIRRLIRSSDVESYADLASLTGRFGAAHPEHTEWALTELHKFRKFSRRNISEEAAFAIMDIFKQLIELKKEIEIM